MLEFQDKKKIRRLLYSRSVIIILIILSIALLNAAWGAFQKAWDTAEKRDTALLEKEALLARESELKSNINELKTERGVEEEIRKKYRVVKEGESVIIVVEDKEKMTVSADTGFKPLFQRIWELFK